MKKKRNDGSCLAANTKSTSSRSLMSRSSNVDREELEIDVSDFARGSNDIIVAELPLMTRNRSTTVNTYVVLPGGRLQSSTVLSTTTKDKSGCCRVRSLICSTTALDLIRRFPSNALSSGLSTPYAGGPTAFQVPIAVTD